MTDLASLHLDPGNLSSDGALTVKVESAPQCLVDEAVRCTLRIVEVDDEGQDPVRLAEFSVDVVADGEGFAFANAERVLAPKEKTELPGAGSDGIDWKVPHFVVTLEGCPGEHTVLVGDQGRQRFRAEGSVYELAVEFSDADGVQFYPAGQEVPLTRLECVGVLAENCALAAAWMMNRHNAMIDKRGYGYYFGSSSTYRDEVCGTGWKPRSDSCHVCALRVDDEFEGRTPAANSAKGKHTCKKSTLTLTDCTAYIDQVIKKGYQQSRAKADARLYTSRRACHSGLEVGGVLRRSGWKTLLFVAGTDNWDDPDPLEEFRKNDGMVTDIMGGTDSRGNYRRSVKIDHAIVGYDDPNAEDHAESKRQFEWLSQLPFVVFLPSSQVHMLMGVSGTLFECHWGVGPRSKGLFEAESTIESYFKGDNFYAYIPRGHWRPRAIERMETRPIQLLDLQPVSLPALLPIPPTEVPDADERRRRSMRRRD